MVVNFLMSTVVNFLVDIHILILIPLGVVTGIQPIISYNYGAKLYERVREVTRLGMIFMLLVATFLTVVLFLFTDPIVSFFSGGDPALQEIGVWSTRVFNISFPLASIIVLISGYFEAIEKNVKATLIAVSRSFIFCMPLYYLLPGLFGVSGVWYSVPLADVLAFLFAVLFMNTEFHRLKRMTKQEVETI
ncbi:MATE family efflux transporter [Brevibacillus sp. SYSU BS000544]|uniref:MATE family efflux transporter n=1 Tax=Brevibacillus sp. SYSU BS000544 TaxID=3416443 RepID=UPI003CE55D3B